MSPTTQGGATIVNGAAGNVGRAVVRRLLADGWSVVACLRSDAAEYERELGTGSRLAACAGDLADPAFCAGLVETAKANFGGVGGAVHTVGGFATAPVSVESTPLFAEMFKLNLLTAVTFFAAVLPEVRRNRGALVAISAGAALRGRKDMAAYSASKAALTRLMEALAEEGGGLRSNALLPDIVDTPANRKAMPGADRAKWVAPDEVAAVVAFLLSESASGVSGAAIPVARR